MLRFTTFQATFLSFAIFFMGFSSYRFFNERWSQHRLQQQLLGEGFQSLPTPISDQPVDQPIAKLTGEELLAIREEMKVDINTADVEALTSLPSIGPATAQNIIDYRKEHGGFQSIDELTEVKRIGPALLGKIREHITASPVQAPDSSVVPADSSAEDSPESMALAALEAPEPVASSASAGGKIDINTAPASELETLPRIGPSTAKAIVDYRTRNGPFRSIDELANVPRIGDKTVANIRSRITVGAFQGVSAPLPLRGSEPSRSTGSPKATPSSSTASARTTPRASDSSSARSDDKPTPRSSRSGSSGKDLAAGQKININTASESELTALPGVGPSTAQKIVEYREVHGRFSRIEDITKVKGIGPSKFAKMKDHLSVQ